MWKALKKVEHTCKNRRPDSCRHTPNGHKGRETWQHRQHRDCTSNPHRTRRMGLKEHMPPTCKQPAEDCVGQGAYCIPVFTHVDMNRLINEQRKRVNGDQA
jgi:hypothetical protein